MKGELLPVEQRHREAAADLSEAENGPPKVVSDFRNGRFDTNCRVQSFARFERDHLANLTSQLDKAREALERAKSDILDLPYTNRNGDLSRQRTAACERIDAARACLPATSGDVG